MATNPKVHPFPEIACPSLMDKVLEAFMQTFMAKLVFGFIRGTGLRRLVNGTGIAMQPGQAVTLTADNTLGLASPLAGCVGVVNALNDVAAGGAVNVKSVGEYDVFVDAPGAAAGDDLWLSVATPGNFTTFGAIAPNQPGYAQVVDASAYAVTGKVRAVICFPACGRGAPG